MPLTDLYSPEEFRRMLPHHAEEVRQYMACKAVGRTSGTALRVAFGHAYMNMEAHAYIDFIECSAQYMNEMPKVIETYKDHFTWDQEISARNLFSIATNESAKHSDRLNAIKELNVMFNITYVDENGKTRSSEDLFKDALARVREKAAAKQTAH